MRIDSRPEIIGSLMEDNRAIAAIHAIEGILGRNPVDGDGFSVERDYSGRAVLEGVSVDEGLGEDSIARLIRSARQLIAKVKPIVEERSIAVKDASYECRYYGVGHECPDPADSVYEWHIDEPFAFLSSGIAPIEFAEGTMRVGKLIDDQIAKEIEGALHAGRMHIQKMPHMHVIYSGTDGIHRRGLCEGVGFRHVVRLHVE